MRPQVAADRRGGCVQQTALFGPEHVEQLAAPRHQRGERLGGRIGQGPRRRLHHGAELREQLRIEGVGLGEAVAGLGIRAHLARIDHGDAQAGAGTRGRRRGFVAARRLEHDERRGQRRKARHEAVEGGGGRGAGPRGSARVHGDGELGFADVDANHGRLDNASWCHRAARPYASADSRSGQLFGLDGDVAARAPWLAKVSRKCREVPYEPVDTVHREESERAERTVITSGEPADEL